VLAFFGFGRPARVRADSGSLDPAVLKKGKAATVHLEVEQPDGTTVEGSGVGTVNGATQVALDTGEVQSADMNFKADADIELKYKKTKLTGTLAVRVRRDIGAAKPPDPSKDR
jgi:hypothetical protein